MPKFKFRTIHQVKDRALVLCSAICEEIENRSTNQFMALGGKRPGAGRKKGTKLPATLEREAVLRAFRERAMKVSNLLLDSQLTLARGQTFLYKIEKERIVGPKGGISYRAKKPEIVTAQWEIEAFLEKDIQSDPDPLGPGDTYYYLTTKEPNNQAIDSIYDRTFGKSIQAVELTGKNGKDLFNDVQKQKSDEALSNYFNSGNS